jgi:hypothetical protein
MLDKNRAADEILAEVCVACDIETLDSPKPTARLHLNSKASL